MLSEVNRSRITTIPKIHAVGAADGNQGDTEEKGMKIIGDFVAFIDDRRNKGGEDGGAGDLIDEGSAIRQVRGREGAE